jgi:hypothetical protein
VNILKKIFLKILPKPLKTRVRIFAGLFLLVLVQPVIINSKASDYPELVIGIAQWRHAVGPQNHLQDRTYQRLVEALEPMDLNNVTIKLVPVALNNAHDVDAIADQFGVNVVVWGWYDEVAVRGYVDLAHATTADGMANSLSQFLEDGNNTEVIRVLKILSEFDYYEDGVGFCVPRWTP